MKESIFDHLNNLFEKRDPITSDKNQPPDHYMLSKFISYYSKGFTRIARLNEVTSRVPSWAIGCMLYWVVPKMKVAPRINFIKKDKEGKDEIIQKVGEYLCCNPVHAQQAVDILISEGIDIHSQFGIKRSH